MNKKLKVRKSIKRRFKVTKTGKILHGSSFSRHLRRKKNKSHIRRLKQTSALTGKVAKKVRMLLGK